MAKAKELGMMFAKNSKVEQLSRIVEKHFGIGVKLTEAQEDQTDYRDDGGHGGLWRTLRRARGHRPGARARVAQRALGRGPDRPRVR